MTESPHPRETSDLVGHSDAERTLLEAYKSGRLAHAWLITGPRGIGKATLAYRFARFLLSGGGNQQGGTDLFGEPTGPSDLAIDPESEIFRRIAAGSHGELTTIERSVDPKSKKLRGVIVVDDVRRLNRFFGLTAAEGGWRVAIVDSADEMNNNAANALLKMLEEPPRRGILLLVAHAPGRLPATIRSRCRLLPLRLLSEGQVAEVLARHCTELGGGELAEVAKLAGGSPGRALTLAGEGGVALHREITALLDPLPDLDVTTVYDLADRLARADGAYRLFTELIEQWLATTTKRRASETQGGAREIERWIGAWDRIGHLIERASAVNLDKRQVVVAIFTTLQACVLETAA